MCLNAGKGYWQCANGFGGELRVVSRKLDNPIDLWKSESSVRSRGGQPRVGVGPSPHWMTGKDKNLVPSNRHRSRSTTSVVYPTWLSTLLFQLNIYRLSTALV